MLLNWVGGNAHNDLSHSAYNLYNSIQYMVLFILSNENALKDYLLF